jgi:hypothetical protein
MEGDLLLGLMMSSQRLDHLRHPRTVILTFADDDSAMHALEPLAIALEHLTGAGDLGNRSASRTATVSSIRRSADGESGC